MDKIFHLTLRIINKQETNQIQKQDTEKGYERTWTIQNIKSFALFVSCFFTFSVSAIELKFATCK